MIHTLLPRILMLPSTIIIYFLGVTGGQVNNVRSDSKKCVCILCSAHIRASHQTHHRHYDDIRERSMLVKTEMKKVTGLFPLALSLLLGLIYTNSNFNDQEGKNILCVYSTLGHHNTSTSTLIMHRQKNPTYDLIWRGS